MKSLIWLLIHVYSLGLWSVAIMITIIGLVPFSWWLLASIFNVVGFFILYFDVKDKLNNEIGKGDTQNKSKEYRKDKLKDKESK